MLKMIGLVPAASEVILRTPEAICFRLKALWVAKRPAALRRSCPSARNNYSRACALNVPEYYVCIYNNL